MLYIQNWTVPTSSPQTMQLVLSSKAIEERRKPPLLWTPMSPQKTSLPSDSLNVWIDWPEGADETATKYF